MTAIYKRQWDSKEALRFQNSRVIREPLRCLRDQQLLLQKYTEVKSKIPSYTKSSWVFKGAQRKKKNCYSTLLLGSKRMVKYQTERAQI